MTTAALSTLLSNATLSRLERLRLELGGRFTNTARGDHLRGRGGASIDFADYRDYAPGDDLRAVDWNIFARLHRPYLKQYQREEETHCLILVDASASMGHEGKLHRACQLAAALAIPALFGGERLSLAAFGAEPSSLPACRGRAALRRVLDFAEGLAPDGSTTPTQAVAQALSRHRGRGIAVVISDFLAPGDPTPVVSRLRNAGLEPWLVQVLSPLEVEPRLEGDLRLVDCETEDHLDVSSVADLLSLYRGQLAALQTELTRLAVSRGGRFLAVVSDEDLDRLLFERLRRAGWWS